MAGLFGSLQTAGSGMRVSQASIQTASHNITNMNTPGYSRQRVEQSASRPYSNPGFNSSLGAGQIGTGVQATNIMRIRNTFYDFQFRSESHSYGETSVKYEYYTNMEKLFNEPSDSSISSSISNFFSSWQELNKNPQDLASKDTVIQNSKYLASSISSIKEKLEKLTGQAEKKLNDDVKDINSMLDQLKELDKQIKIVEGSGKTPNDLMDERDAILDELSYKVDINDSNIQEALKTGELKVAKDDNGQLTITDANGKKLELKSGELKGSIDMMDKVGEYTESLTELAKGIAQSVNNILNGRDINDTTTEQTDKDLFKFDPDKDPMLEVNEKIVNNPKGWEMTSEIASQMYKLKDTKISIGSEEGITIDTFYNNVIQKLGNESQEVIRNEKNQSKVLQEIDNLRLNVSGVSLDEEMVNLIQFQHAYNASAKVMSTIDSLLDVVINGII